jgi:signal transduction histidine kinase
VTDSQPAAKPRGGYLRRWRDLPRELAFLLTALPVAIATCVACWVGISLGLGLAVLWIGFPIGVATLLLTRRLGAFELRRLRAAGLPPIQAPDWSLRSTRPGTSLWRRLLAILSDGRTWSYWAHAAVVELVLAGITWSIGLVWAVVSVSGTTYWFWGRFLPRSGDEVWLHTVVLKGFPGYVPEHTAEGLFAGESVFYAVGGAVFLFTLPVVTHGLVLLHHAVARLMLGEGDAVALRREIAASEASRVSAILAEDDALRRLERDIHDGPQQSLLRVQYDLSSSLRALKTDDDAVRPLLESALGLTKDTLQELRDLSRGMAPPLLQDRGLASAIRSLAARNPVPTTATVDLPDAGPGLGAIERSVYFVVSELLANVAKHSEASAASVTIRTSVTGGLLPRRRRTLVIEVVDNGRGGAQEISGHGLSGLGARVAGLRGALVVDSPDGGPSRITVTLPVGSAAAPDGSPPVR